MPRNIRFGFSPCPNDTFAFHALVHGLVSVPGFDIQPVMSDVEELNQKALAGELEMTKLSFHALGHVLDKYTLLNAGSALGRGCGPLLVARPGKSLEQAASGLVAAPGQYTTAQLLLTLFLGRPPQTKSMVFNEVMPAVSRGEVDAGLIIHEGRFTYGEYGLESLVDLGRWWEEQTSLPIPLGCIAVRRDLGPEAAKALSKALAASVSHAWRRPEKSQEFVAAHAQEMEPEVIRRHIELYVNDFTLDLGDEGRRAVDEVLRRGAVAGLLPSR